MRRDRNIEITKPHIVFCEGEDDKRFISSYLKYLNEKGIVDTIEAHAFEGISKLNDALGQVLTTSGNEMLQSILIIRDAEKDAKAAIQ